MTEQEKQLLLVDLCARLPYNVRIRHYVNDTDFYSNPLMTYDIDQLKNNKAIIKPYLRPMSSMTKEEKAELNNILPCGMSFSYTIKEELIIYTDCEGDNDHYFICFVEVQDFLNAHHFDYRNLISIGLAIEASEGMYNT